MCRLQMSWCVFQFQAICNHIADSLAVTQNNEKYYYLRLKGKKGHWLNPLISFLSQTKALVNFYRL